MPSPTRIKTSTAPVSESLVKPLPPLGIEHNPVGGPRRRSLLDGVIQGLFGTPTSEMTPEEGARVARQREAAQDEAYDMAVSAMKRPGESFMGPPKLGGGGDLLKIIAKLFSGG